MPVPTTYFTENTPANVLKQSVFHFCEISRFEAYLSQKAILSKGMLWGLGLLIPTARTVSVDAANGFIDYIFFGTTNWLARGRSCYYGYIAIECAMEKLLSREYFCYTFNSGVEWSQKKNNDKYSDLTCLDKIFDPQLKNLSSEILVRRKVSFDSIKAIHLPQGLQNANGELMKEVIKKQCPNLNIVEKELNNTQAQHAYNRGYRGIEFDNVDVFDTKLEDRSHSGDYFEIVDADTETLVFFTIPNTTAVADLVLQCDDTLIIRGTKIKVGRLIK